ncbi:hypothetical protein [Geminicoccus flavidas]|uniref:hypothetical protein n=1 Tax=Geminicoccus flavidas TaxID=2506407 RepID=UPI00135CE079|nr:hypothetical protein [Geminicoccus flavidas]
MGNDLTPAGQAAIDALDATLTNVMSACPDAYPNFKVSTASAVPVELLAIANSWAVL